MGLSLRGTTSGAVDINAPAVAGDNTITLPGTNGAANQFYKNSGTAGIVTHSSMVEDSSGSVGIGTDDPQNSLHINGATPAIRFSDTGANGSEFSIIEDNNGLLKVRNDAGNSGTGSGITFEVDGSEKARIDSSGNVGIGTDNPGTPLTVKSLDNADSISIHGRNADGISNFTLYGSDGATQYGRIQARSTYLHLAAGDSTKGTYIDSSGRLLVGLTASTGNSCSLQISAPSAAAAEFYTARTDFYGPYLRLSKSKGTPGSEAAVSSGDELGTITFQGYDGSSYKLGAHIAANVDGTPGSGDMPCRLTFATTSDGSITPTERMRITKDGRMLLGTGTESAITTAQQLVYTNGITNVLLANNASGGWNCVSSQVANSGTYYFNAFLNGSTLIGSIRSENGTTTNFNTSSDYRLKENIIDITGAIDRVKQLQPRRFNFIADPDRTVDGFIAHEAQTVIPEAVHGTKDEVDDDGKAVIQGIDQSKLVPLLTAALQEAITKIETLETQNADLLSRVTALEG